MRSIKQIGKLCQDNIRVVQIFEDRPSWDEIRMLDKHNVDMHCSYCQHSFLPCETEQNGYDSGPTCPRCRMT